MCTVGFKLSVLSAQQTSITCLQSITGPRTYKQKSCAMACVPAHEIGHAKGIKRFSQHTVTLCRPLRPVTVGCLRVQHATSRSRGRNTLTMASMTADSSCAPEQRVDSISNGITIEVCAGPLFALSRVSRASLSFLLKLLLQTLQLLPLFPDRFFFTLAAPFPIDP